MKRVRAVQTLIFLAVVAALAYVVIYVADGWGDWVVFGVFVLTAVAYIIALNDRQYPAPTKKRSFTRDPDSRW